MERKDFLKGIGLAGAGALLPIAKSRSNAIDASQSPQACTLIPAETRGPYPLPSATNVSVVTRTNIKESKTGLPLQLTILVQNLDCSPISGARVDILHFDKDGYYSGYNNQPGYLGTQNNAGTTFLRGSQTTGSSGQVIFDTIYPGWYTGRVTHIHAEVYIGGVLKRTSQFAFPDALNTTVYTTSAFYTAHSTNNIVNSNDNVFSDGVSSQLLNINGDVVNGYIADHTFTIDFTVVPLSLLSINAVIENNKAVVWWAAANEINVAYFAIERSSDGTSFLSAGNQIASNRAGTNTYSFTDAVSLTQNYYYRLKMVNVNGSFTYSPVVLLKVKAGNNISVYPNPAKDKIVVSHPAAESNSFVEVLALDGKSVAYSKLPAGSSATTVSIEILSKGVYFLAFISNKEKQVVKFVKQ